MHQEKHDIRYNSLFWAPHAPFPGQHSTLVDGVLRTRLVAKRQKIVLPFDGTPTVLELPQGSDSEHADSSNTEEYTPGPLEQSNNGIASDENDYDDSSSP
ncbi:hypothetical protein TNCV_4389161 [Trichonephila clavipes]|nr:hypothetical protein TNCV_4389161 [Trichonephila clavipes]